MKERPILFTAPMVRAILDGSKTQTRRIMKPQPQINGAWISLPKYSASNESSFRDGAPYFGDCPYGKAWEGNRLYVRETWQFDPDAIDGWSVDKTPCTGWIKYAADNASVECSAPDIATIDRMTVGHDACSEGVSPDMSMRWGPDDTPRWMFGELWESINGPGSWEENPWVWVIDFRRILA